MENSSLHGIASLTSATCPRASDAGIDDWCQPLIERLLALPFPTYAHLVRRLLAQAGYDSVRACGHGYERGNLSAGGFDLLAFTHTDLTTGIAAVQVKQYREKVPRRFVDELRGAMQRLNVEQGVLVTTSRFSPAAIEAARLPQLAPVTLVDGRGLAELMAAQGTGVTPVVKQVGWKVDETYFEGMDKRSDDDSDGGIESLGERR